MWHQSLKYPFPYLYDETQEVAKAYDAACTPDFFIYDKNLHLFTVDNWMTVVPANEIPVTGKDIRNALDCLINDQPVPAGAEDQVSDVTSNGSNRSKGNLD